MVWWAYNCVFPLVFLALLPRFLARMAKRGGYRRGFFQRLGCYDAVLRARLRARPRLWVHAVSVGEIQVALRFMGCLRQRLPGLAFTLTTTTSTGHALAADRLAPDDVLVYVPVDVPAVVDRVLDRLRPLALVLVESELWPNLVRLTHRRGVPILLLNGRVSERSFRRYHWGRPFIRRVLAAIDVCCMQSATDARRIEALGAAPGRVQVMGSAKYDVAAAAARPNPGLLRAALARAGLDAGARWLVGGSTWPGEETVLLDVFRRLRERDPAARLALVPRHAERREAVLAEIRARGLKPILWSAVRTGAPPPASPADILLVDTTGDLLAFYALADLVFVGKSLTARGGQNVIEPAACGKPVLVGPHTANFAAVIEECRAAGAIREVPDAAGLDAAVLALWADAAGRAALGRRAAELVRAKAGALDASADCLLALLVARPPNAVLAEPETVSS